MIIADILQTDAQQKAAVKLYKEARPGTFARRCAEEIIKPNIEAINKKVGQENDPLYLAYAVEYAISQQAAAPISGRN